MQQVATSGNHVLTAMGPRAFAEWRPIDDLILTALAHTRAPVESMAERLGRTAAEVEDHLRHLGLG